MADRISVKIINFEKYKGREDVKKPWWFKLSNRFIDDHEFFGFTAEEKLCWIYLLSISSQRNQDIIHITSEHAHHTFQISKDSLYEALKKLSEIRCIEIIRTDPYAIRTDPYVRREEKRLKQITKEENNSSSEIKLKENGVTEPGGELKARLMASPLLAKFLRNTDDLTFKAWGNLYDDFDWVQRTLLESLPYLSTSLPKYGRNVTQFFSGTLVRKWTWKKEEESKEASELIANTNKTERWF